MARVVAMVFDDPDAQVSQPTLVDEVAFGLENLGVPWDEMDERIRAALGSVGLGGLGARDPATLSGGEQQRLAIACAIAMRPSVLVMDEPTSNLDPAGRAAVFEIAVRLHREEGMTVIVAEHDVEALAEHATRIVALDDGAVVMDGPPAEVFGRLATAGDGDGVTVPEVTAFATRVGEHGGRALPVTVDEAVAWLGRSA